MSAIKDPAIPAEVICQFRVDGTMIPIKFRIEDEDGQYQAFSIKSYKDVTSYSRPDNDGHMLPISGNYMYLCKIIVFNEEKMIKLIYNLNRSCWLVVYNTS